MTCSLFHYKTRKCLDATIISWLQELSRHCMAAPKVPHSYFTPRLPREYSNSHLLTSRVLKGTVCVLLAKHTAAAVVYSLSVVLQANYNLHIPQSDLGSPPTEIHHLSSADFSYHMEGYFCGLEKKNMKITYGRQPFFEKVLMTAIIRCLGDPCMCIGVCHDRKFLTTLELPLLAANLALNHGLT